MPDRIVGEIITIEEGRQTVPPGRVDEILICSKLLKGPGNRWCPARLWGED